MSVMTVVVMKATTVKIISMGFILALDSERLSLLLKKKIMSFGYVYVPLFHLARIRDSTSRRSKLSNASLICP